ncbi:MAG: putative DNA-binding domain-containing protein [Pseudomonadota bacterium]|nr:putative DNA-binding domain-containing protein [Pseudomonadota bacterium]
MSTLKARQFAFAAHLRNADAAPPPGIEARRLAVYRELFFNTLESLLASNFPVIKKTLGQEAWLQKVRDFHREYRAQTPLFTRIGCEFIDFLQQQPQDPAAPWLAELAHYEWMELKAEIDDSPVPPHDANGDLLLGIPQLSPQVWPLAYQWPVEKIGPSFRPTHTPEQPTLLLVYRDAQLQVRFSSLAPLAYRLLQLLAGNHELSGHALLQQLAREAGQAHNPDFFEQARQMLAALKQQSLLLGTRI